MCKYALSLSLLVSLSPPVLCISLFSLYPSHPCLSLFPLLHLLSLLSLSSSRPLIMISDSWVRLSSITFTISHSLLKINLHFQHASPPFSFTITDFTVFYCLGSETEGCGVYKRKGSEESGGLKILRFWLLLVDFS